MQEVPYIQTFKLWSFKDANVVFSTLVALSEKLELDLQEDDLIELLAVQHEELTNEDLKELEAQRKGKEREEEEEVTEEPMRFTMQEMAMVLPLFEEALFVSFWGTGPECKMVLEGCSSRSERNPVLLCHLWEKKSCYPDITGSFFQEGR